MEWNLHTLKLQTIQRNRRRYRPENKQLSIVCLFNALFNRLTRRDGITHRIAQVASLCTVYLAWSGVAVPQAPITAHFRRFRWANTFEMAVIRKCVCLIGSRGQPVDSIHWIAGREWWLAIHCTHTRCCWWTHRDNGGLCPHFGSQYQSSNGFNSIQVFQA